MAVGLYGHDFNAVKDQMGRELSDNTKLPPFKIHAAFYNLQ